MRKISALLAIVALLFGLTACQTNKSSPQATGQKLTQTAFNQQQKAVPYPVSQLTDSTERRNLREKLLRFNKPDRVGYVYIFNFGKVEGYYVIEGKVSSNDSQMTTSDFIVQNNNDNGQTVVRAPGDDGSYGASEPGIFFFTVEGALVQTNQDYLYSDQPIPTFLNLPKLNGTGKVADLTQRK